MSQSTTTEYSLLHRMQKPETFKDLSPENPPEDWNMENSSIRRGIKAGENEPICFFKDQFLL